MYIFLNVPLAILPRAACSKKHLPDSAAEPSSGSNVIPMRARPGLAGLRPHTARQFSGGAGCQARVLGSVRSLITSLAISRDLRIILQRKRSRGVPRSYDPLEAEKRRTMTPVYSKKSHATSPFQTDIRVTADICGHVRRDWYKFNHRHLK